MIEEFISVFTYWPRSLAESFGDLLGLALPQSVFYAKAKQFYDEHVKASVEAEFLTVSYPAWNQNYDVNFLKPTNPQFTRTLSQEKQYIEIPINYAVYNPLLGIPQSELDMWYSQGLRISEYIPSANPAWRAHMRPYVTTRYDSRLFSNVSNDLFYRFKPDSTKFQYSYIFIMSYTSQEVVVGQTFIVAKATASPAVFSGVNSILALHENEKSFPDVSMQNLYEFKTYLDAYEKNLSQIAATVNNSEAAARDELTRYSRELQTQIDNEQRNLENLAITLQNQTQAESFEVSRDIANLILTAQGVALQISERLP